MLLAHGARSAEESADHVSAAAPFDAVAGAEFATEAAGHDDLRRIDSVDENRDAAPHKAWCVREVVFDGLAVATDLAGKAKQGFASTRFVQAAATDASGPVGREGHFSFLTEK